MSREAGTPAITWSAGTAQSGAWRVYDFYYSLSLLSVSPLCILFALSPILPLVQFDNVDTYPSVINRSSKLLHWPEG